MNLERSGGLLALVANLGVVGGLVLLAVEVRHNTQVVRAQASVNLATGQSSAEVAFMGEDTAAAFVTAINTPGTITDREIVQLWAYLNAAVLSVQQTHAMFELGLATEEDQEVAARSAAHWLGWNFGRVWWAEIKTNFPSDLVAEIDAAITTVDSDYLTHQLQGMKDGMASLAVP
jgi:hypothetical protein